MYRQRVSRVSLLRDFIAQKKRPVYAVEISDSKELMKKFGFKEVHKPAMALAGGFRDGVWGRVPADKTKVKDRRQTMWAYVPLDYPGAQINGAVAKDTVKAARRERVRREDQQAANEDDGVVEALEQENRRHEGMSMKELVKHFMPPKMGYDDPNQNLVLAHGPFQITIEGGPHYRLIIEGR